MKGVLNVPKSKSRDNLLGPASIVLAGSGTSKRERDRAKCQQMKLSA
jgi:hypothetical protein